MMSQVPEEIRTCVFVFVQDHGHFNYTTHLAWELHQRGYNIEYWSNLSARNQCPSYASFFPLTDDQRFIKFYCAESSRGDSDSVNIDRMSQNINQLMHRDFSDDPLVNLYGDADKVLLLKQRLLKKDVVLCVNDKCQVFSWAGEHCEKYKVPTLNLCPSQHELQRQHAGVLDSWKTIFGNIKPWSNYVGANTIAGEEQKTMNSTDG